MYVPVVGAYLTISLPGELLRATIEKVITKDSVIARIFTQPMAKAHNYKKDDFVACRRQKTMFGEEWEAVDERRMSLEKLVEQEKKEVPKPIEEKKDAVSTGKQPKGHKPQHKRNGKIRVSTKTSRSSQPKQRKKAS